LNRRPDVNASPITVKKTWENREIMKITYLSLLAAVSTGLAVSARPVMAGFPSSGNSGSSAPSSGSGDSGSSSAPSGGGNSGTSSGSSGGGNLGGSSGSTTAVSETSTSTTNLTGSGTITAYTPGSDYIMFRREASTTPVKYYYTENTVLVDPEGHTVKRSDLRSDMPVTYTYVKEGDRMVVTKVTLAARLAVEKKETETTTTPTKP